MNSIWSHLYDRFKDRRYGLLFFTTLVTGFGLLVVGVWVCREVGESNLRNYFLGALPGIFILMVVMIWRAIRQMRAQRREQLKFPPLSRDERAKARSKLRQLK